MANYLKPQSPLQHKDGDYFYPLTTIDQIITDNDTRLNAELISVDLSGAIEGVPNKINADTLGGYTAEDIVQQVITALGTPVFGTVDTDNNIILTGNLIYGTYTLKYEDAEGNQTDIGTVKIGSSYTNLADPTSSDWLDGKRVNSSGNIVDVGDANQKLTNIFPLSAGENQFHIKGMNVYDAMVGEANYCRVVLIKSDGSIATSVQLNSDNFKPYYSVADYDSTVAIIDVPGAIKRYGATDVTAVRFGGYTTDSSAVIITRDEQIV